MALYIKGSDDFVTSIAALIATGWNEPVPRWVNLPLKSTDFHGAPLAVRLTLPLAGCVEDLHLQVSAPCRAHPGVSTFSLDCALLNQLGK